MSAIEQVKEAVERAFADTREMKDDLHGRIRVNRLGELQVETHTTRNPNLMSNGGEYTYYRCFRPEPDGVMIRDDWSADFDPQEWLGADIFDHLEILSLDELVKLANDHADHLLYIKAFASSL